MIRYTAQELVTLLSNYQFEGISIPEHGREGLIGYLVNGRKPGSFLTALLTNDLKGVFAHGDEYNRRAVNAYVAFLYNHAPMTSWGNSQKFEQWLLDCRSNQG